jgi:hypothetical protein
MTKTNAETDALCRLMEAAAALRDAVTEGLPHLTNVLTPDEADALKDIVNKLTGPKAPAPTGWRTYQCHKRVKAAQIESIHRDPEGRGIAYHLVGGQIETVAPAFEARYQAVPGDYLVEYLGDGYRSVSPRKAFEDGYRELPGEDELAGAVNMVLEHYLPDAAIQVIFEGAAVVGVHVTIPGHVGAQVERTEPLTDEVACLMFATKAGMAIAERIIGAKAVGSAG